MAGVPDDKTGNTSLKGAIGMVQQFREHPHGTATGKSGDMPKMGTLKSAPTPKS